MLSSRYAEEVAENCRSMAIIAENTHFLACQRIPFQSDDDEADVNYNQLLNLRSDDNAELAKW